MLRTILIGTCVWIQGEFERTLADGRVAVRLDGRTYVGRPTRA